MPKSGMEGRLRIRATSAIKVTLLLPYSFSLPRKEILLVRLAR